jgi:hypothetical protein
MMFEMNPKTGKKNNEEKIPVLISGGLTRLHFCPGIQSRFNGSEILNPGILMVESKTKADEKARQAEYQKMYKQAFGKPEEKNRSRQVD